MADDEERLISQTLIHTKVYEKGPEGSEDGPERRVEVLVSRNGQKETTLDGIFALGIRRNPLDPGQLGYEAIILGPGEVLIHGMAGALARPGAHTEIIGKALHLIGMKQAQNKPRIVKPGTAEAMPEEFMKKIEVGGG